VVSQTGKPNSSFFGRLKEKIMIIMMMTHTVRPCYLLTTKKPKQQTPQITPTKQPTTTQKKQNTENLRLNTHVFPHWILQVQHGKGFVSDKIRRCQEYLGEYSRSHLSSGLVLHG